MSKVLKVPEGKSASDYQKVYNDIATKISENLEFDENAGYYGQLLRLAWHTSGTYDKSDNSGGSYGGTMIFAPEEFDPENAGLQVGREFLMEFLVKYPWISRGDLWTLGGVAAVQESGGPKIEWNQVELMTILHLKSHQMVDYPMLQKMVNMLKICFARMGFNEEKPLPYSVLMF